MKFPKSLKTVLLATVPFLVKRAKWRAQNPGPADITVGLPTKTPKPVTFEIPTVTIPETPMKVSFVSVMALIAGLFALFAAPEVAPLVPDSWEKAIAGAALVLASFAPEAFKRPRK